MVKNIVFKCWKNIDMNLTPFIEHIKYLNDSRIDGTPIYQTDVNLMFSEHIIDILNNRNKSNLELILRKKKIEKIIKNHKIDLSLNYEFLDFWYKNFDDLFIMVVMDDQQSSFYNRTKRMNKLRYLYNKITIPGYKLKRITI